MIYFCRKHRLSGKQLLCFFSLSDYFFSINASYDGRYRSHCLSRQAGGLCALSSLDLVMVLIDGNNCLFCEQILIGGEPAGAQAAEKPRTPSNPEYISPNLYEYR